MTGWRAGMTGWRAGMTGWGMVLRGDGGRLFRHSLRQGLEAGAVADEEFLAAALDDALGFPGAEQARDGVQRRAGHFRHVLPGKGEVDAHPLGLLPAGLVDKTQHRMGDAALHLL